MTTVSSKRLPASFDLIIVGAGHAGCEAAMTAARLGLSTLLLTSNADRIGHLSCNPAIGGLGKGHMVREIDALGGYMSRWTDTAAIQVRTLNASKGPAVRATRSQVDREVYMAAVKRDIYAQPGILVRQEMAESLLTQDGRVVGIRTSLGTSFTARAVLLTTGTFLGGHIHIGRHHYPGGRLGDAASSGISASLRDHGIALQRFMTCTTPRILGESINFSLMEPQLGDEPTPRFSPRSDVAMLPQAPCYLTWTTAKTHAIIDAALQESPMYNGAIPSAGPRYCPAIEDKIARFPEKGRHQIFVEPEGVTSPEYYPNGLPTGLPLDVQMAILHSIPGLEDCHVVRPGYAIEYDVITSTQLAPTLENKILPGLWSAGQINGTSGYEEAAAQGLWAAINIGAQLQGRPPFTPKRDQSYIAVLVDDLVTKGTNEPYRMFTSRAEHRLLLRESNADARLTPLGREHGLIDDTQWEGFSRRQEQLEQLLELLRSHRLTPNQELRDFCQETGENVPTNAVSLGEFLRRPGISIPLLVRLCPELTAFPGDICAEAETMCRYEGYVARQEDLAKRQLAHDEVPLPAELDYVEIHGLDLEAREKLSAIRPATLGQAGRIAGISPAAITCIEIQLRKLQGKRR